MAGEWRTGGEVEAVVAASPDEVYAVVSDVTSTGERSEECRRVEWLPGSAREPVVGARFRGWNRAGRLIRWSRVCEVLEAEPGRAFAFRTVPERWDRTRADSTTWRFDLEPVEGGTRVRHSYRMTVMPWPPFQALAGALLPHHKDMRPAMQHTLDALAAGLAARRPV